MKTPTLKVVRSGVPNAAPTLLDVISALNHMSARIEDLTERLERQGQIEAAPRPKTELLYGVPAIAAVLGMREKQCRHRIDEGRVPTFRIGDTICARRVDLTKWLANLAGGQVQS